MSNATSIAYTITLFTVITLLFIVFITYVTVYAHVTMIPIIYSAYSISDATRRLRSGSRCSTFWVNHGDGGASKAPA